MSISTMRTRTIFNRINQRQENTLQNERYLTGYSYRSGGNESGGGEQLMRPRIDRREKGENRVTSQSGSPPPTISSSSNISGSEINRTRLRQTPVTKPAFLRILSVSQFSPISIIKNTCVHTEFEDPKNYLHSFIDIATSMYPHLSSLYP